MVASQWLAAFAQRQGELGWVDGRNVTIEVRWAEGRGERAAEIAAEFVRPKVNIIATWAHKAREGFLERLHAVNSRRSVSDMSTLA